HISKKWSDLVIVEFFEQGRPRAYTTCVDNTECGDGLECVAILGAQVCTRTGCGDGSECPDDGLCVVSAALDPSGICIAVGGGDPFCGRNCRDPLACNLNAECAERGCCTEVTEDGCPSTCADLARLDCQVSPQCAAECCE
ncbi:MAG: hypothetical protein AAFQ82_23930, partial [Myxococcota bacterium]